MTDPRGPAIIPSSDDAQSPAIDEPWTLSAVRASVLASAALLGVWPLAGGPALATAAIAAALGVFAARLAMGLRLRAVVGAGVGLTLALLALPLSDWIGESTGVWGFLSSRATVVVADATLFGGLALGAVFAVRCLAIRNRAWSVLEAAGVIGAVAHLFARHRELMINRPRWLSDWALTQGLDPQVLLQALGVLAAAAAVVLALRRERPLKLALTLLLLVLVGAGVYWLLEDQHIDIAVGPTAGLMGEDKDGDGKPDPPAGGDHGNSGMGGASNNLGDGSGGGSPPPPRPVALALFHDDFDPEGGLYYFRQQVLSRFDGTRLSIDQSAEFDGDVLREFPVDGPLAAAPSHDPAFYTRVPTTMFLLVDHPQPLALTASIEVRPHHNPAPRRFVAAYDAVSLALSAPTSRLVGRGSIPADWSPEKVEHYLAHPDDPRYAALADELARDVDPRFAGDPLMVAYAIKRYLEREGFYTRKERHLGSDPTGSFLFGSLRGYCVHFAHAAANLFRSQGIASRVAVGYAVDAWTRGAGSAVLILGDRAHAWPEIHIAGVGWVPFDIYPEQSDEPPPRFVDQSLESLLGELARDDPTGGRGDPDGKWAIPWVRIGWSLIGLVGLVVLMGFTVKLGRMAAAAARPESHRLQFASTLDRFSDLGLSRRPDETRERHAERLAQWAPSLVALTRVHLRLALGRPHDDDRRAVYDLARAVRREYRERIPGWKRALGSLNPFGWWFTR